MRDLSYPSGHSLGSTAIYATLTLMIAKDAEHPGVRRMAIVSGVLLVLAIVLSRMYVGVHYPTDVAGGIVAAVAWLALVQGGFELRARWHPEEQRLSDAPPNHVAKSGEAIT